LIAIGLPSIAFFATARQPKTKSLNYHKPPASVSPINNTNQSCANQGNAMSGQAKNTGKKSLGNNKAIVNTGLCTA
jgi:hypothetical protein